MAPRITRCLSSLALLLFIHSKPGHGQTGEGCFFTTCNVVGQIRINAIYDAAGNFIGGCNCACDPNMWDPVSPAYCAAPNVVHFDPVHLTGDCSCAPALPTPRPTSRPTYGALPVPQQPAMPILPTLANYYYNFPAPAPPVFRLPTYPGSTIPAPAPAYPAPAPAYPAYPANPGYPAYPQPAPAVPAPTMPLGPGIPVQVVCDGTNRNAPCECPLGTRGECTLICEGGTDACKDTIMKCNNDGYACFVGCLAENACSGSTTIDGPVGASLEVICGGMKSCEGNTQFNGQAGTDMTVVCDGMTSCKGVSFNFGTAVQRVECNGDPDSCIGAVFNLPPYAETTPGAAYSCVGQFCPEAGVLAPEPFSNVQGVGGCLGPGDCACKPGLNMPCTLTCDGQDACKDGIVECNSDGYDCTIDCIDETSCSGSTQFIGPVGASLTVNCIGNKACEGGVTIDGSAGTGVLINCKGNEACKGSVSMLFGSGAGSLFCVGAPDSCQGATITLLPGAETMPGAAFSCTGDMCPPEAPAAFSNPAAPVPAPPVYTYPAYPQYPANPQYPAYPANPQYPAYPAYPAPAPAVPAPVPAVPAPLPTFPQAVVPPPTVPQAVVPPPTVPVAVAPLPTYPISQIPATPYSPGVSPYCCVTSIPNFKPWAGRCWDETTEGACVSEPNNRCVWDTTNCQANPPVNSVSPNPCLFYNQPCTENVQCCSETCNSNGFCR